VRTQHATLVGEHEALHLAVESRDELDVMRERIEAAGGDVGEVQRLGGEWSLFFRDIDGMELEVCAPADEG
jgi:predicted lactoylglutathione lyase